MLLHNMKCSTNYNKHWEDMIIFGQCIRCKARIQPICQVVGCKESALVVNEDDAWCANHAEELEARLELTSN